MRSFFSSLRPSSHPISSSPLLSSFLFPFLRPTNEGSPITAVRRPLLLRSCTHRPRPRFSSPWAQRRFLRRGTSRRNPTGTTSGSSLCLTTLLTMLTSPRRRFSALTASWTSTSPGDFPRALQEKRRKKSKGTEEEPEEETKEETKEAERTSKPIWQGGLLPLSRLPWTVRRKRPRCASRCWATFRAPAPISKGGRDRRPAPRDRRARTGRVLEGRAGEFWGGGGACSTLEERWRRERRCQRTEEKKAELLHGGRSGGRRVLAESEIAAISARDGKAGHRGKVEVEL